MKFELGGPNFSPRIRTGSGPLQRRVGGDSHDTDSHPLLEITSPTDKQRLVRTPELHEPHRGRAGRSNLAHHVPRWRAHENVVNSQSTFEGALKTALWNYKPKP
jgi:hypothetical protein